MSKSSNVERYFSAAAADYQAASARALWRLVRTREAGVVAGLMGDVTGKDVLELGCGAGFYTRALIKAGARHVVAVDLSQNMLDQLPSNAVTPVLADATTVDPGRAFPVLMSAGMLEFVPDAASALRNAGRFAELGATMVVLVPTVSMFGRAYRRFHRRNGMVIRLFDQASLMALAEVSGWRLAEVKRAGPYSVGARLVRDMG